MGVKDVSQCQLGQWVSSDVKGVKGVNGSQGGHSVSMCVKGVNECDWVSSMSGSQQCGQIHFQLWGRM